MSFPPGKSVQEMIHPKKIHYSTCVVEVRDCVQYKLFIPFYNPRANAAASAYRYEARMSQTNAAREDPDQHSDQGKAKDKAAREGAEKDKYEETDIPILRV
jgi:hypothetical protein